MAKHFHQCVDADVGVCEFRGVGVAQSVYQSARDGLSVGTGEFECSLDAGLQCSLCNALAVAADKQR